MQALEDRIQAMPELPVILDSDVDIDSEPEALYYTQLQGCVVGVRARMIVFMQYLEDHFSWHSLRTIGLDQREDHQYIVHFTIVKPRRANFSCVMAATAPARATECFFEQLYFKDRACTKRLMGPL